MRSLLLITTSYPTESGDGSEAAGSFVADFAEELSRQVHVTVLAPGVEVAAEMVGNPNIRRFGGPAMPLSLLNAANPTHWPNIIRVLRAGALSAEQLAQNTRFDHVLALWALPSGYWASRIKRRYGVEYSVWALGSDIWSLKNIPFVRSVLRSVLRDSRVCFADGYQLREEVMRLSGRACHFLPSLRALPIVRRKQARDRPPYRLAFLGRWHRNKGIDLLLDGLGLLDDSDWRQVETIRICGGGPLEPLVRSRAAALAAAGRPVTIHGFMNKREAVDLLAWADYLLVPSRIESIPVIFSDAIQAGCPVVSTPVGDLPKLIQDYQVGILAAQPDAPAITAAIREATRTSPARFVDRLETAKTHFSLRAACDRFMRLTDLASPHDSLDDPVSIQS